MPFGVGLAIVWAGPAVEWLLPAYRDAVPALRFLAAGALALSAATVPSYFLLGCGRQLALLGVGVVAAAANAVLVFGVASRRHDPAAVALAAAAGYALFALLVLSRSAAEQHRPVGRRIRSVLATLAPAVWGTALAFSAVRLAHGRGAAGALLASAGFALGYLPPMIAMGRGLGIGRLARGLFAGRRAEGRVPNRPGG